MLRQGKMEIHSAILSKCQVTMANRLMVRYGVGLGLQVSINFNYCYLKVISTIVYSELAYE